MARDRRCLDEPDVPALMDPRWAPWSIGLADLLFENQEKGCSTNEIMMRRPGGHTDTKTRQCLAFLDLAGCAWYQRGVWRLSAYGLLWRERQDRHELDKMTAARALIPEPAIDPHALADAAARQAEASDHVREQEAAPPRRRRKDARTADEALQETLHARIQTFDGNTGLQVDAILRVLTADNVDRLMELLPDSFRSTFVDWCCRHYLFVSDDVERVRVGRGLSSIAAKGVEESIAVICNWLRAVHADDNSADMDVCMAVADAKQEYGTMRVASADDDAWKHVEP